MCGVAGFVGDGDKETLLSMTEALSRRGPDDRGYFLEGDVGIAHTRLSIIDLSPSGHQPLERGNTIVAFNGEIYNFKELRLELESTGRYHFTSESDTEVIAHLFSEYGEKAFEKLNGMFAIALFDRKTRSLYLVRDRLGKKPLYFGMFAGTFIFGSELKALMRHSLFKRNIDIKSLAMYLTREYVPTPHSIFDGVEKLIPGTFLVFGKGKILKREVFWRLHEHSSEGIPFDQALGILDQKLAKSVSSRLISDVPLGVFLSGGLDSSTIAYYAKRESRSKLKTFTIGFDDGSFDESAHAEKVAQTLGTDHTVERFSSSRCLGLIPEVFSYIDEPIADPSILPTYLLASSARKKVTVTLGGDGGDELFAGYSTFQAEKLLSYYNTLPKVVQNFLIEPLIKKLPVNHSYMSLDFKLKKFIEGAHAPQMERHLRWLGAFSREELKTLLVPDVSNEIKNFSPYQESFYPALEDSQIYFNKLSAFYLSTYLLDEVLVKVDRTSMANSLEVRAPFLDFSLVEFVHNLHPEYKLRGFSGKYILKRLMEGKLPQEIINRPKKGFAIPVGKWLLKELTPLVRELLSGERLTAQGLFNPKEVDRFCKEHWGGVRDNRKRLWTLITFQLWYDNWYHRT